MFIPFNQIQFQEFSICTMYIAIERIQFQQKNEIESQRSKNFINRKLKKKIGNILK